MTTAIVALLCSCLGFVFGWMVYAFMTAGKTEDPEEPRLCSNCGHSCNYHIAEGCQVQGCGCPQTLEESLL